MNSEQWLAAAGIAATLLIAAASWHASRRRTKRDLLLQDLHIRDRLDAGTARDRLEDSIDERVARMAYRSERATNDDLIDIGRPLTFVGILALLSTPFTASWVMWSGAVILAVGASAWIGGLSKDVPEGKRRVTPRRPPRPAGAAAPPPIPEPAAPASDPGPRGLRGWLRRRARPAARRDALAAPRSQPGRR
jgi:hypothetical protein